MKYVLERGGDAVHAREYGATLDISSPIRRHESVAPSSSTSLSPTIVRRHAVGYRGDADRSLGMLPSASLGEIDAKTKSAARCSSRHARRPISQARASPTDAMISSFGMRCAIPSTWARSAQGRRDRSRAASGLRTADIKSEGTTAASTPDRRRDPQRIAEAARVSADVDRQKRSRSGDGLFRRKAILSAKRVLRAAEIRRRAERLAVDRTIEVFARE